MKPAREKIARPLHTSICCFRRDSDCFEFGWHLHPEYELTLIAAGSGQRFVGDDISTYRAGDLVLLGPNLPHTWVSDAPTAATAGVRQIAAVVQFDRLFVERVIGECVEWRSIVRLLTQSVQGVGFDPQAAVAVNERMIRLPDFPPGRQLAEFLGILWDLSQLPDEHRHTLAADVSPLSTGEYDRIDRMCRYLDAHLAEPISPERMAAEFHMSTSSFGRFFKQATHRSLIQYLNERRIGWACRLLQETDEPITTVGLTVGFTSPSYFNRVFVKCKGIGPREYRRQFQKHVTTNDLVIRQGRTKMGPFDAIH